MRKQSKMYEDVKGIKVTLIDYPKHPEKTIDAMLKATWRDGYHDEEPDYTEIERALTGHTIGNALESLQFTFAIEGVSRSFTHQLVRQRIGVGFAQEGGRDNDWSNFDYTIPKTIAQDNTLKELFQDIVTQTRNFYKLMMNKGIPYQDARFILPIATNTYIIMTTNFRALQGFVMNRLCNCMQWEINYVARLIVGEVKKVSPLLAGALKSKCEIIGKCAAVNPTLFAPCGFRPLTNEILTKRKYHFPNNKNKCSDFAQYDVKLNRKWLPNFDGELK